MIKIIVCVATYNLPGIRIHDEYFFTINEMFFLNCTNQKCKRTYKGQFENKTLIKEMKIDELPTLLLYENKEIKWKHTGYISEEDLKKQLQ